MQPHAGVFLGGGPKKVKFSGKKSRQDRNDKMIITHFGGLIRAWSDLDFFLKG